MTGLVLLAMTACTGNGRQGKSSGETAQPLAVAQHDRQSSSPARTVNADWNGGSDARASRALRSSGPGSANIYYRCPACQGEHPLTMMQTDSRASFEAMSFNRNVEGCPKTGQSVVLGKSELFWKDDVGTKQ